MLAPVDPPPVEIINPAGASSFLLIGDHAGNRVPSRLASLGLPQSELDRHIGWDIGVAALGVALAGALDAAFVRQAYSRLVIDCNRDPDAPDAIAAVSDGTTIPANQRLSDAERSARVAEIHEPYQAVIAERLAALDRGGARGVVVSLHSFTPVMDGIARPWQAGVLHDGGDDRFARAVLGELRRLPGIIVGDNQPYRMDSTDHTVPRHAYPSGRPYVEIEIRQDELASDGGIARWCDRLSRVLRAALPIRFGSPI